MQRAMTSDAKLQFSLATALRSGVAATTEELAETEADLEMGSDLGVDLGMNANSSGIEHKSSPGPATLAEYCAGGQTKQEKQTTMDEGTKVKANWEGYGSMYPGKITDTNRDGSVDIKYDDGFTEKRVDVDDVQVRKNQGRSLLQEGAPRDDPACKLQDFLDKLKKQLKAINDMIGKWLASQRAKVAGDKAPPQPPPSLKPIVTAAPAAAPMMAPTPAVASTTLAPQADSARVEELEKLKAQLADRDKFLAELEKMVADNEKELQKYLPAVAASPPGITSVDDLIAQYKEKIAQKDARIAELQKVIQQQQDLLEKLSGKQLSLAEIDAAVHELENDVAEAKQKRDKLKEEGKLDDELRYIIDSIIDALKKLRAKVDNLLAMEKQAEDDRAAAGKEAAEAAEKARAKAVAEGKDPEAAAKEAMKEAERETREALKTADLEAMKAAQEVGKDLEEAEKGAMKLDTGLHPHGDKWWRFRYEHSYIEAMVMIFVSFLMLLWSELIEWLRNYVMTKAQAKNTTSVSELELVDSHSHGAVYVTWLRDFAEQMMVCIFVFLTIFIISKTMLLDYAPMIIKASDDLRVPLTGAEYRHIALDILTIFFIAIVFYFSLMFPVARHARKATRRMEKLEGLRVETGPQDSASEVASGNSKLTSVAGYSTGFKLFVSYMERECETGNKQANDIRNIPGFRWDAFPLNEYLTLNVRLVVPFMFRFGWVMWLPVICLFMTLLLLHRFAHMGYVRIICFFAAVVLLLILGMVWFCRRIEKDIGGFSSLKDLPKEESIHNRYPTEVIFLGILQFCLFFTCYGVARMICQTWMWELHFWPVLCLTLVAAVSAALFVWLVAPTIPAFVIALALPPYIDGSNWDQVKYVAKKVSAGTAKK
jgi:hypothetical protein